MSLSPSSPLRSSLRKPSAAAPSAVASSKSPSAPTPAAGSTSNRAPGSPKTAAADAALRHRKQDSDSKPISSSTPSQGSAVPLTFLEGARVHAGFGYQGLKDASAWPSALIAIYGSKTIQANAFKCLLLNGLLFLGSIFLFDYAVLPVSRSLRGYAATAAGDGGGKSPAVAGDLFDTLLGMTYSVLWVYPIYAISFILNAMWYQRIADRSYRVQVGKPVSAPFTYDRLLKMITDEAYRGLLLLNFLAQSLLVYFIPYVGPALSFLCFCWVASFYSFEYRWASKGWSLQQRVDHFESHWAYYIGFGFPVTALTFFFPQFISQGLFALLFPVYIIMSNRGHPQPKVGQNLPCKYLPQRLPIFRLAVRTNACCIRRVVARNSTRRGSSAKDSG
ncbi:etoposide-induced protein 2.4-domain-containing protein [Geranomyces variabilis]|nr:etoposide-induced protein 2.4-domain-containing protein [Geranomyces variabilis]KAJ3136031.1 Etoposide induced 2.4 mRNA [Geranomyces variabilis]